jgi:DnaJ-class molecular chaperone
MTPHRDFYQVLGLRPDASRADIRAAFVRLSKRHHPDLAGSDGVLPSRFQEVQQAYRCLSDSEARATHDRLLDERERQHVARQRAVQRRLHQYDRRHPRPLPSVYRRNRWRVVLAVGVGAAIIAHFSLPLIG